MQTYALESFNPGSSILFSLVSNLYLNSLRSLALLEANCLKIVLYWRPPRRLMAALVLIVLPIFQEGQLGVDLLLTIILLGFL